MIDRACGDKDTFFGLREGCGDEFDELRESVERLEGFPGCTPRNRKLINDHKAVLIDKRARGGQAEKLSFKPVIPETKSKRLWP